MNSTWEGLSEIRFKGVDVQKTTSKFIGTGFGALLDSYGLDTKETLSLDRSALTHAGYMAYTEILQSVFLVYRNAVLEKLGQASPEQRIKICQEGHFLSYQFWLLCGLEQRNQIPEDMLRQFPGEIDFIAKSRGGSFQKKTVPAYEVFSSYDKCHFVSHDFFKLRSSRFRFSKTDYEGICAVLNRAHLDDMTIIADNSMITNSRRHRLASIQIPLPSESLLVYTVTSKEDALIDVDAETKRILLRGLSGCIPQLNYGVRRYAVKAKRYAVPAFKEYRCLAVELVSSAYSIAHPQNFNCAYIIAPFVREEAELRTELSRECFIERVMSSETFPNLVEYVVRRHVPPGPGTADQVREAYRRLIGEYYDAAQEPAAPPPDPGHT